MGQPVFSLNVIHDGWSAADSVIATKTVSGGSVTRIVETLAIGTDTSFNCAIDVSTLQAIAIYASSDVTLESNSGSAPDDTLTIDSATPFVWLKDSGIANPLTTDVVTFKATNAAECTLTMIIVQDATP